MRKLWIAFLFFAATATLSAQPVRTWVSVDGLDSNPCSRTQPCRNFGAAVDAVNNFGEVVALDSGGYGPLVLDKSVTILAPWGVHAAIAPTTDPAIRISFGAAKVTLRNLLLISKGSTKGIDDSFPGAIESLHLDSLRVKGFSDSVDFRGQYISVFDSWFEDGGSGCLEVFRNPSATTPARAVVERTRFWRCGSAVAATAPAIVTVRESELIMSPMFIRGWQGDPVEVTIENSTISHYGFSGAITVVRDAVSGSQAIVRLANNLVVNNQSVITTFDNGCPSCLQILTRGDNVFEGNTSNGTFTGTYPAR